MRLQLTVSGAIAALGAVGALGATARADGELVARTAYYKERATRVIQPMLDGMFDIAERGTVTAHFLVDAITSASTSSGAANAKAFSEKRYEAGFGYTHQLASLKVGGDAKYSTESDYDSFYLGLRGQLELAQKNAVLGAGAGVSLDSVSTTMAGGFAGGTLQCDPHKATDTHDACSLDTYSGFASFSQILGRNAIAAVTYDVSSMRGYQSNPYRTVITAAKLVAERHPDRRLRQAVGISARYYVPATETTLVGAYRYYRDDWHVRAHTPELRIIQQVGQFADAAFRYRYYAQSAAYFYLDKYPDDTSEYVSDDAKLSQFTGHTLEAKLGIYGEEFGLSGIWGGARFEGLLEYEVQNNRFGNAVIAHVALTVPFTY